MKLNLVCLLVLFLNCFIFADVFFSGEKPKLKASEATELLETYLIKQDEAQRFIDRIWLIRDTEASSWIMSVSDPEVGHCFYRVDFAKNCYLLEGAELKEILKRLFPRLHDSVVIPTIKLEEVETVSNSKAGSSQPMPDHVPEK